MIMYLQAHVRLLEVADSVTLEEVNTIGASVLSYISHYRKEAELLEEAGHDPSHNGYALWGPTRMTSIVACIPAFMDASGQSTGNFDVSHIGLIPTPAPHTRLRGVASHSAVRRGISAKACVIRPVVVHAQTSQVCCWSVTSQIVLACVMSGELIVQKVCEHTCQ